MELTRLLEARRIAVDTVAFIYLIEEHATFLPVVEPIFEAIDGGAVEVVQLGDLRRSMARPRADR